MSQRNTWFLAAILFLVAAIAAAVGDRITFAGAFIAIAALCLILGMRASGAPPR